MASELSKSGLTNPKMVVYAPLIQQTGVFLQLYSLHLVSRRQKPQILFV